MGEKMLAILRYYVFTTLQTLASIFFTSASSFSQTCTDVQPVIKIKEEEEEEGEEEEEE